jgi:hypothetical protein
VASVKFVPVIVITAPATPPEGVNEDTVGGATTVKFEELVPVPPTVVTEIGPVVAPVGTVAVIWVDEFTVKLVAFVVLNLTTVAPVKSLPVNTTVDPIPPDMGVNEETVGGGTVYQNDTEDH